MTQSARELFDWDNHFDEKMYRALFAEVDMIDEFETAEAVEGPEHKE